MGRLLIFGVLLISGVLLQGAGANAYIQHNLISDEPGVADVTDPNLVNAWDIATTATSPFWISSNGTGSAVVYSTANATPTIAVSMLKVSIPRGNSSTSKIGAPTGQIANDTSAFALTNGTKANFLFCTEDGTISGWNSAAGDTAVIMVDNSSKGAVYKGCVLGGTASSPQIYAANFNSGAVEIYDGNFAPVSLGTRAFTDSQIPAGFAPFNIVNLNGNLYVAYAKQDAAKQDEVSGPGYGYIDVYDMNGNLKTRLVAGGSLNSPWGMTIAPATNFGPFSGMLLIGNYGDGQINAYDPSTGALKGAMFDTRGNPITIPCLWGLHVGNGSSGGDANAVYFAAAPDNQQHGLFGSLQAGPVISSSTVVNGASFLPGMAQKTWVTVFGANLASTKRMWTAADMAGGKLPVQLDGAGVTINGKSAYISYVSPTQIDALVAADLTLGPVKVTTANAGLISNSATVTMQNLDPAFFISKNNYIAGFGADNNTMIGPTTLFPNQSAPVKPGDQISLYGTGFGAGSTAIPDGVVTKNPIPISGVSVMIGGTTARVAAANLVGPGLYQLNVIVPANTPNGDAAVIATVGNATTQSGALINVQQ
ncbi:MAG: TIGR03118 family protein [Bryobacterales bacterium]|nr:TIGR03118 family protein [Bryobacterales bacterium]MBV9397840.1 TIGR03118 family protein [Bryobacterales bacterium]